MDCLGPGLFGGVEDPFGLEVALGGGRRSDSDRVVGFTHVQRGAVGLRIDRDRLDAQIAAGADHAHGDLAAIRYQDALEHRLRYEPACLRPIRERTALVKFIAFAAAQARADAGGSWGRRYDASRRIHSGILPCLRGGLRSRLFSSALSAAISRGRVSRGISTSSM